MARKIIEIDERKCNGCGQCVDACHEGALVLIGGKAKLAKESFCDGLGACIGECPTGALKIIEREAEQFDQKAVEDSAGARQSGCESAGHSPRAGHCHGSHSGGCPGSAHRLLSKPVERDSPRSTLRSEPFDSPPPSQLGHWPVQLALVSPSAPFLKGASVVVCADCVPFAVPDFHERYLKGRTVLVGCPKLDDLHSYSAKLSAIVKEAEPSSLTILRMEVPCCRGLAQESIRAARESKHQIPVEEHVVGIRGGIERSGVRLESDGGAE